MNGTHGRPDQALDMTTVVFAAKRTILDSNAPIFAGRFEGVAVEFLGIVDVDRLRNAGRRPNQFFQCPGNVHRFPAYAVVETQCDRQDRRLVESDVGPENDPGCDVDGHRQIRSRKWPPIDVIDQRDVRSCMIDLNDLKRGQNLETAGTRGKDLVSFLALRVVS